MERAEFDKFADEYRSLHAANISLSGETPEYFAEYKVKDLTQLPYSVLQPSGVRRILDFGAGVGTSIPYFTRYFPEARVTCLDVSTKSLVIGDQRFALKADFVCFDGRTIPFASDSIDLVFVACVLHHIPIEEHLVILRELHRVLRPGGTLVIYEHNPLNPLTVHAVNTCPFDENAVLLKSWSLRHRVKTAGFQPRNVRYRIFFPRLLSLLRPLERALMWLPLGAQYCIIAAK